MGISFLLKYAAIAETEDEDLHQGTVHPPSAICILQMALFFLTWSTEHRITGCSFTFIDSVFTYIYIEIG